ncbi:MAG: dihydropteroate synthase [Gammaproteobacteria bacterium]|nr:MAG: dihydropteroate synthase [Gammaproteobacteria bacterium]
MNFGGRSLDLSRPQVMGILNITPDSFADGGRFCSGDSVAVSAAAAQAELMVRQGASIIDIGGESTRPGAAPVSVQQEMDRVLPVLERLTGVLDAVISVDTSTPELMREAAKLGAGLLNDVRALTRPGALQAAADTGLPVCLMHMQGTPDTMQQAPEYDDVVADVRCFFGQRIAACEGAGISKQRLLLDPGFGFGKNINHNLTLLRHLAVLSDDGLPLLVGLSRKSMIDHLLGRKVSERLAASIALAVLAVERGAAIVRVHDVQETADAVAMSVALRADDPIK